MNCRAAFWKKKRVAEGKILRATTCHEQLSIYTIKHGCDLIFFVLLLKFKINFKIFSYDYAKIEYMSRAISIMEFCDNQLLQNYYPENMYHIWHHI